MSPPGKSAGARGDAGVRAIHEAAHWYARLRAGPVAEALQEDWEAWYAASEEHQTAWQKIAEVQALFGRVPPRLAGAALTGLKSVRRRSTLRTLGTLASIGVLAEVLRCGAMEQGWFNDYTTASGERRRVTLADGSVMDVNARTRVDVEFSHSRRLVRLHAGDIVIDTAADPFARPFQVETLHGSILALGTRFEVRATPDATRVAVLEKAVAVSPWRSPSRMQRIEAGQQVAFSETELQVPERADARVGSWAGGHLVVVNMPLRQLLAELARYMPGYLGCDPALAEIKVSGAFPVDDVEQALQALSEAFPIRIKHFTRYWIRVEPRTSV